jgi:multidrug efflux pump subunit AcrB
VTNRLAQFVQAHARAMAIIVFSFALAGLAFIFRLPIAIFPQTDFPRIVILVDNGITPVDIQMLRVTRPIEETIRIVPGVTTIRSTTARGSSEISVFFRWDVDILMRCTWCRAAFPRLPHRCRRRVASTSIA